MTMRMSGKATRMRRMTWTQKTKTRMKMGMKMKRMIRVWTLTRKEKEKEKEKEKGNAKDRHLHQHRNQSLDNLRPPPREYEDDRRLHCSLTRILALHMILCLVWLRRMLLLLTRLLRRRICDGCLRGEVMAIFANSIISLA